MTPTIDLASCLAAVPDRRSAEGKLNAQVGAILFSTIAKLSGARSSRRPGASSAEASLPYCKAPFDRFAAPITR
jgi:hypothetical protein